MTEWVGGRRPVAEALSAGRTAHRLLVSASARPSPELKAILSQASRAGIPVQNASTERIARAVGFEGHQGLALEVADRRWSDVDEILARAVSSEEDPFILVLEHLQDPTNLGTLLRSGEAAGVHGVIFPEKGAAPLTASAVKASAGASEHLLLARVESLGSAIHELKGRGVGLVAGDQDAATSVWEADLSGSVAIVVGSEGSGLSGATKRRCDLLVRLPMAGRVASLNAATAGALLLFEVVRQRSSLQPG